MFSSAGRSIAGERTNLQVVGEPEESRVGVLHGEEHVAPRHDAALWDSFDPDRKAAVVSLTHRAASFQDESFLFCHKQATQKNATSYLQDFSPSFFVKHLVFEVHLVEELGFLNLFFCDHLAYAQVTR